jgi:hypothetical protein
MHKIYFSPLFLEVLVVINGTRRNHRVVARNIQF